MLDLGRFSDWYNVRITGVDRVVHKWSEDGEAEYVLSDTPDWMNTTKDLTMEEIQGGKITELVLEVINEHRWSSKLEEGDLCLVKEGYIQFNQLEDNDGYSDTSGNFIVDYTLKVSIKGLDLTGEELQQLFPNAEV